VSDEVARVWRSATAYVGSAYLGHSAVPAGIGGGIGGYVLSRINRYVVRRHDSASIQSPGGTPVKARPNPSSSGRLRLSTAAALVER
jgi:hypothetical protein